MPNIKRKAVSKRQQKAAALALLAKRGKMPVSRLRGSALEMYRSMTASQLHDFATTSIKRLPWRVKRAKKKRKWVRKIDTRMRTFGEIDETKKRIRVNPKKGELLNTILHEELHRKHKKMTEKQIRKRAAKIEKKLTPKKAIKLLGRYTKKKRKSIRIIR